MARMRSLWMGIMPRTDCTRIVVQDGWAPILLKARLPHTPEHPQALEMLGESIALWCGRGVCAALVVDGPGSFSATQRWQDTVELLTRHARLEVHLVSRGRPVEKLGRLDDLYDYHELQLDVFSEVKP